MAMRKSTRAELAKNRELLDFLLTGRICYFCRKPLLTRPNAHRHGDGNGSPIHERMTIHHIDGDHDNDAPQNKTLAHATCHQRYHILERNAAAARIAVAGTRLRVQVKHLRPGDVLAFARWRVVRVEAVRGRNLRMVTTDDLRPAHTRRVRPCRADSVLVIIRPAA